MRQAANRMIRMGNSNLSVLLYSPIVGEGGEKGGIPPCRDLSCTTKQNIRIDHQSVPFSSATEKPANLGQN